MINNEKKGLWFKNPANGYLVQAACPRLWTFLFGPFYLMSHGVWGHAFILLFTCWLIVPYLIYVVVAPDIIADHYGKKGWLKIK